MECRRAESLPLAFRFSFCIFSCLEIIATLFHGLPVMFGDQIAQDYDSGGKINLNLRGIFSASGKSKKLKFKYLKEMG